MIRHLVPGLLAIVLVTLGAAALPIAQASPALYPPCDPFQFPTENAFCRPAFIAGTQLRIRAELPFAWLRASPDSQGRIILTLRPTETARIRVAANTEPHWDETQWWWLVETLDGATQGWVEQASVEIPAVSLEESADMVLLANWKAGTRLMIRAGLPFLWLREQPAATAMSVGTLLPGDFMRVLDGATFDGVQWWWRVEGLTAQGWVTGYVEQARAALAQ